MPRKKSFSRSKRHTARKKSKSRRAKAAKAAKAAKTAEERPRTQDEVLNVPAIQRRIKRRADGLFEVAGKFYKKLVGSRDDVYTGVAYKTNYNADALTREDLVLNPKTRKVVSKKKQDWCKTSKNVLRKKRLLGKRSNIKHVREAQKGKAEKRKGKK